MTPTDIAELLAELHAAYPQAILEDDTPALWYRHLQRFERLDAEAACVKLIETCEWFPSLAKMIATCQDEARAARAVELAERRQPVVQARAIGAGTVDRAAGAAFARVASKALAAARVGGAAAADRVIEEEAPMVAGPTVFACDLCRDGHGWIARDDGTMEPCPECKPELRAWWREGHHLPGHVCEECARKGRTVG